MDVREKLLELFGRCAVEESITIEPVAESRLVDFLVNHGVTVQEWISVDDRLPEPWEQVLIYSRHDFCESAFYIGVPGKWRSTWNHEMLDADSVTYWMPMLNPPKGE